jgi:uncharacterized protein (TIGR03067 family)
MRTAIATLALLLIGSGPTRPDLRVVEGFAALRGTWRCVSLDSGGRKSDGGGHTWTFDRGQLTLTMPNGPAVTPYVVVVDASRHPAGITLTRGNTTWNGVYVIRGGVLEVRLRDGKEPRPNGFGEPPRPSESLATYQRVR